MKQLVALVFMLGFSLAILCAQTPGLPEGEGRNIVQNVCGSCHDADIVAGQKHTKEGWQGVVDEMVARGASVSDDEAKVIVTYLTKNFGEETK
jgi:competence protein ComEA